MAEYRFIVNGVERATSEDKPLLRYLGRMTWVCFLLGMAVVKGPAGPAPSLWMVWR